MNKNYFFLVMFFILGASQLKAQVYVDKISKDSLNTLNGQLSAIKANQKLVELKLDEAKQEDNIESIQIKLKAANEKATESAAKASKNAAEKLEKGKVDTKEAQKLAKTARSDMQSAEKILKQLNKETTKLEKLRIAIAKEAEKVNNQKTILMFFYR